MSAVRLKDLSIEDLEEISLCLSARLIVLRSLKDKAKTQKLEILRHKVNKIIIHENK